MGGSRPSSFALTSPGPMRLYSTAELLKLPPPDWLVDNIMPEGGLVGLYGPPESAKSFIAIDLALCVASGTSWHGHEVKKGFVLYVAAEGGPGIGKRVRAWLQAKKAQTSQADVAWLIESLSIYKDSSDMDALMSRLDDEMERAPVLIIVDTLARCFDGDENQQEDMGRFVAGLDKLRHEYGATLVAIHHTRLDGDRERGNTAFRGGTDTMISVTRGDSDITLECTKQKDAEHFPSMSFQLVPIEGTESCIVECMDGRLNEKLQQTLGLLADHGPFTWDEWLSSTELPKTTFSRRFSELKKKGLIIKENSQWRVLGAQESHSHNWHK